MKIRIVLMSQLCVPLRKPLRPLRLISSRATLKKHLPQRAQRTSQRRAEEKTLECGGLTPLWI